MRSFHPSLKAAAVLIAALAWAGVAQPQAKQAPPKKSGATTQSKAPSAAQGPAKTAANRPAQQASERPAQSGRRDPFEPLVQRAPRGAVIPDRLPAGKAGLVISTMSLDGVVRSPNGMIAVVSNPQRRVYFLREGDRLYDGRVERITMDGMTLRESSKDAFGKPLDRIVSKRLYPSAGESR